MADRIVVLAHLCQTAVNLASHCIKRGKRMCLFYGMQNVWLNSIKPCRLRMAAKRQQTLQKICRVLQELGIGEE